MNSKVCFHTHSFHSLSPPPLSSITSARVNLLEVLSSTNTTTSACFRVPPTSTSSTTTTLTTVTTTTTQPMALTLPSSSHSLQVPENEKQFLLSPPGSPPSDWEQLKETEPNYDTGIANQPNLVFLTELNEKLQRLLYHQYQYQDEPSLELQKHTASELKLSIKSDSLKSMEPSFAFNGLPMFVIEDTSSSCSSLSFSFRTHPQIEKINKEEI